MFNIVDDILNIGNSLLDDRDFTKQDLINLTASGLTLWEISQGTGIAIELLEEVMKTD